LVVNPNDIRYKKYIGDFVINPLNKKKIRIISDGSIDPHFGTGIMKCTPAHSFEDFEIAKKNNIDDFIVCINQDGTLNVYCGKFCGMDRIVSRKKIVSELQNDGYIEKIEVYTTNIGYSERSGEIIEPLLSCQ
jgi:valyl-tRNA synthetase